MFDQKQENGFDLRLSRRISNDPTDRLPVAPEEQKELTPTGLQSAEAKDLQAGLLSFYQKELERQEENRTEMSMDEDFFDNDQWSEPDLRVLNDRGQKPLVYNVIATTVNWVTGSEKRARTEYKVLPRRKDGSKAAERKTQLLKYLSDTNRTPFHKSRAFEDAVKVGLGWLECGVQDDDDGEPVYTRFESWRNILWDSAATEMDLSDGRYQFRVKWIDLDVATAMFPKSAPELTSASVDGDVHTILSLHGDIAMDFQEAEIDFANPIDGAVFRRPRVRLIESWYRRPVMTQRMSGGDFAGEVYIPGHPGHEGTVKAGNSVVVSKMLMRMHVAVMTPRDLLYVGTSPYKHNAFPLTPVWGNRRGRDGMPYGMIRGLRSMQEDINKRAAKALHILNTNKVVMDEGAVPDLEKFADEVARPDAIIVKRPGKELVLNADRGLDKTHLEMMSRSIAMVQQASGVTDELMGRSTNAKSGIAIERRQTQGSVVTASLFENLRLAYQIHGEKELSLVEQYFTAEKQFRITNMRGSPEYVTINDGLPENDITRTKADFVISEDDWRATVRQAETAELLELMKQVAPVAPALVMAMLDLVVEGMDIPNREELVRRIRQVTGMSDPDAEQPSPEQIAKMQAAQQQQARQDAMADAEIAEKQAKAAKTALEAKSILSSIAGQNVETQKAALETALGILSAPPAVPVADGILHEAGYTGRTEQTQVAQAQADKQRQAQLAQQQQQMAAQQQQQAEQEQAAQPQQPQPGAPAEAPPAEPGVPAL